MRTWLARDENFSFSEMYHFNEKNKAMTDALYFNQGSCYYTAFHSIISGFNCYI